MHRSRLSRDQLRRSGEIFIPGGGSSIPASWDTALVRYYFLSNDFGNDSNPGYIDAPPGTVFTVAQARAVAFKTEEQARLSIPRFGSGRSMVILIEQRADLGNYQNKAGANDYLDIGYMGYSYLAVRGSDLTNSVNDHTDLAGRVAEVGPNGDQSWTVISQAGFTTEVATNPLSAEDIVAGLKLQYKGNVTASLRARANTINSRSSTTLFDLCANLGVGFVPVANDEFFIMRPAVNFTTVVGQPVPSQVAVPSVAYGVRQVLAGFEFTATTVVQFLGQVQQVFNRFAGTVNQVGITCNNAYMNESQAFVLTLSGIDFRGITSISGYGTNLAGASCSAIRHSAFHSPSGTGTVLLNLGPGTSIAGGCFFNGIPLIEFCTGGRRNTVGERGFLVGTESATTQNKIRAKNGIVIRSCIGTFNGINVDGAAVGVAVQGDGTEISLGNIVGACTATVLSLSAAISAKVDVGAGITATGATQDILASNGYVSPFNHLLFDRIEDSEGNVVQGAAGNTFDRNTNFQPLFLSAAQGLAAAANWSNQVAGATPGYAHTPVPGGGLQFYSGVNAGSSILSILGNASGSPSAFPAYFGAGKKWFAQWYAKFSAGAGVSADMEAAFVGRSATTGALVFRAGMLGALSTGFFSADVGVNTVISTIALEFTLVHRFRLYSNGVDIFFAVNNEPFQAIGAATQIASVANPAWKTDNVAEAANRFIEWTGTLKLTAET